MAETMRIHRALARAGVASRRHAEAMIAEGRVLINGQPAHVGQLVDVGRDQVQLDGKPVDLAPPRSTWFVLNKPAGYMTTRKDPGQRQTVFELVPDVPSLTYVGRLDFLTEGVLLLTTDGEAAHRLTHPSAEIERVYMATVRGNAKAAAEAARAGVELEDGVVTPAWVNVHPLENRHWGFEIAIREGRTREIRRLCAALGLEVAHLVRTQFGPVRIGQLAPGSWRELSPREAAMLEVFTGTHVPAGKPPRRRDDREAPRDDREAPRDERDSRSAPRRDSKRPRSSRREISDRDERPHRDSGARRDQWSRRAGSSRISDASDRAESSRRSDAPRRDSASARGRSSPRDSWSPRDANSPRGESAPRDTTSRRAGFTRRDASSQRDADSYRERSSRREQSSRRPDAAREGDAARGRQSSRVERGARDDARPDRDASARPRRPSDRRSSRRNDEDRPSRATGARGGARSKVSTPKRRPRSD